MDKLIITVATTGGGTSKSQQPNLPITPEEISKAVIESSYEGATIAHIHVRDPHTGFTSNDAALYKETIERIRDKIDIIINFTTATGALIDLLDEGNLGKRGYILTKPSQRCEPLLANPEMCSFDLGTMNFGNSVFATPMPLGEEMAKIIIKAGVKPEIEIFDTGHIDIAKRFIQRGLIRQPAHFQFCLGVTGGISATPKNLIHLVESIPPDSTWSVLGIGHTEFPMIGLAMLLGGHVRVGFEDNIYIEKGILAESNAQLVRKAADMARILGREICTVTEARKLLGLGVTL